LRFEAAKGGFATERIFAFLSKKLLLLGPDTFSISVAWFQLLAFKPGFANPGWVSTRHVFGFFSFATFITA